MKTNFFKRPSSFLQYRNSLAAQFICILPSYNKYEGSIPVTGSEEMSFSTKLKNLYFVYNHYNVFTLSAWTLKFCTFTLRFALRLKRRPFLAKSGSTHPVTQVISQKARILSYTSIRTSKFAIYFTLFRSCAKPWQVCATAFTLRALFSELYMPHISKIWSKGHIHLITQRMFNWFTTF